MKTVNTIWISTTPRTGSMWIFNVTRKIYKTLGFQTRHISQRKSGDWKIILSNTEKEILNNQFKDWLIEFKYI